MASPVCLVNSASTTGGVNVTSASSVTVALADSAGVSSWNLSVFSSSVNPSPISSSIVMSAGSYTATFTAPTGVETVLLKSIVNGGYDNNGKARPDYSTTFLVAVVDANGLRDIAPNQTLEGSSTKGWVKDLNDHRAAILTGGGGGSFTAGGDLSGSSSSQTVIRLQGRALASTAPSTNQVIAWSGSQWAPSSLPDASTVAKGVVQLAGDLGGSASSVQVAKANGASVPAAGALTTGNVLQVSGASALSYGALNLAGGSNYVTGVLPAANHPDATTGAKGIVQLAGDLAGSATSVSVAKVNGSTVPAGGSLTTGTVLRVTGASALGYGALDLANASAVTGVLPSAKLFQATTGTSGAVKLSGDLGGTAAVPTVVDLTISGESSGSMLWFNGSNWANVAGGLANKVLTANGASAPTWNSLVQGMTDVRSNAFALEIPGGTNAKTETFFDYFTTTSNTQYTAKTITIPASKGVVITCVLTGTDGYTSYGTSARVLYAAKVGKYFRGSTGGVVLSGLTTVQDIAPNFGTTDTIDLSFVISTNDIQIKVTGQNTYNAKWSLETTVRQVSL